MGKHTAGEHFSWCRLCGEFSFFFKGISKCIYLVRKCWVLFTLQEKNILVIAVIYLLDMIESELVFLDFGMELI